MRKNPKIPEKTIPAIKKESRKSTKSRLCGNGDEEKSREGEEDIYKEFFVSLFKSCFSLVSKKDSHAYVDDVFFSEKIIRKSTKPKNTKKTARGRKSKRADDKGILLFKKLTKNIFSYHLFMTNNHEYEITIKNVRIKKNGEKRALIIGLFASAFSSSTYSSQCNKYTCKNY